MKHIIVSLVMMSIIGNVSLAMEAPASNTAQTLNMFSDQEEKARHDSEAFKKESEYEKEEQKKASRQAVITAVRERNDAQLRILASILTNDELKEACQDGVNVEINKRLFPHIAYNDPFIRNLIKKG